MAGAKPSRAAASLLAAAGGWFAATNAEAVSGLELAYGKLTGPFIILAAIGGALLVAAAVVLWFRPHVGRYATLVGTLLVLPWASWLSAPGLWCLNGNCSMAYPLVALAPSVIPVFGFPLVSWLIQRRLCRP